jgi:hypothetical protein
MRRLTATEASLLRRSYSDFMEQDIRPNVAVTATLCQGRSFHSQLGQSWRQGDPISFEGILAGLITRLSKRMLGRRTVEKYGKRIAAGGVIEGNGVDQAYHAHLFLRKPDHVDMMEFDAAIREVFSQSDWLKADLDVQEIEGAWVRYCHKRNFDTFMYL